jgi:signal transduction histidine kinase
VHRPAAHTLLFALVLLTCLLQVAWWILFQLRETARLEDAGRLLAAHDVPAALQALGADPGGSLTEAAARRRVMFLSEGAALSALVLVGVVWFYAAWRREQARHAQHERFLAGAAHDLKTPLATLRLGLESLHAGRVPAGRTGDYAGSMLQQIDRLEADVANLLAAAGLEGGRGPLRLEGGDLAADVRAAAEALEPRFAAAGVALDLELEPVPVLRDHAAMRLVLRNLLENAVKFSASGTRVRAALRRERDRAVLTVSDAGAGIPREELEHVFERFYVGRSAAHAGGTGLGLYLARSIVVQHGGSIEARSDGPGRGSELAVTLPLRQDAS